MQFRVVDVDGDNFALIPQSAMDGTCQECTYWHGGAADDRAALRQSLFADGAIRGKLAVDDQGRGVGFLQYGPLAAYPAFAALRRSFAEPVLDDAWVITCVMTSKSARGHGVALSMLGAAVEQARAASVVLEGIGMEDADFEHVSLGPAALYRRAGFRELERFADDYGINVLMRAEP